MFGHRWFASRWFPGRWFGPADQTAAGIQVLNYGVMRRRREEYERREQESLQEIAQDIAASIDEGLPEPLRPEPASPETNEPDFAPLPPPSHEAVTARVAAEIEARLRSEIQAPAEIAAIEDDYDDDEAAILTLLLAPLVPIANDEDEEALLALLLAA